MSSSLFLKIGFISAVVSACGAPPTSDLQDGASVTAANNSMRMGQGYNSLGGTSYSEDLSYCVESAPLSSMGATSGESLTLYLTSATSEVTLQEALTRSLALGLGYTSPADTAKNAAVGKEEVSNALSAHLDLSQKREVSSIYKSKAVYVVLRARKNFVAESMTKYAISDDTINFFTDRPQEFYNRCGDRFVSGVIKGAEVTAVLECQTDSSEAKNKLTKEVNAKGGYIGISASASAQEVIEKVRQQTSERCKMQFMASGGSGNIDPSNSDQFVRTAVSYITSATPGSGVPVEFESMPYEAILSTKLRDTVLAKADLQLKAQHTYVEGQKSVIATLATQIDRLLELGQSHASMINPLLEGMEKARLAADACIRNVYESSECNAPGRFPVIKP